MDEPQNSGGRRHRSAAIVADELNTRYLSYVGTRTGVEVYAPDATFIGTVPTGESSNATFGGADRRTLFVTSRAELKAVTLAVPGLPD